MSLQSKNIKKQSILVLRKNKNSSIPKFILSSNWFPSKLIGIQFIPMQYTYGVFLLFLVTLNACQPPAQKKIKLEDITDSSSRAFPLQEDSDMLFYDTQEQLISSDRFNQYLADGLYISETKVNIYGKEEIRLVSLLDYTLKLENQQLPEFEFKDLNGKSYNLHSLKGKVTVLSFWFTASSVCTQEIGQLQNLSQKLKNNKIQWLAPALDKAPDLIRFLKDNDWNYTFIADQEELALKLGILSYPTHLIINKEGKIFRAMARHHNTADAIEEVVNSLL